MDKDVDKTGKLKDELGVKTTGLTKSLMVGCLTECINENVKGFKSRDLVNQFGAIEKNNAGTIKASTVHGCFRQLRKNLMVLKTSKL